MRIVSALAVGAMLVCATLAGCTSAPDDSAPREASAASAPLELTLAAFADLPGWSEGAQDSALAAFLATCPRFARLDDRAVVGPAYAGRAGPWKRACEDAAELPQGDAAAARLFFETRFAPIALTGPEGEATGLATAYYEPEIEARLTPAWPYLEPLVMRPANLEVVATPAYDTYARGEREEVFLRAPNGALLLAPPRGAIRRDARREDAIAYAKLSDVVFLQIQGSGRLVMPNGERLRAAYAANNGRPYESIARHLADAGVMPLEQASNARIKAWLDAASKADADRIVDMNERYIFFRAEPLGPNPDGPTGAAGAPLEAEASIAIDPAWHVYGALFWLAPEGEGAPRARLGVAQDTGGAITGPLRADLFFGSGETVGRAAARVRHQARWWALAPREVAVAVTGGDPDA